MEAYTGFAYVYDTFMDNIPYEEWAEYLISLMEDNGISKKAGKIVDLGCGTGNITQILARSGYNMIGIDNSEDMLSIAADKMYDNNLHILYANQDMRELELGTEAEAIISLCDSMNYIVTTADIAKVFNNVVKYLKNSGVFIFDMKTRYFFKEVLGSNTFAQNRENCSYIWDNYYYEDENINEYNLAIFSEESNGLYRKYQETHQQRGYSTEEIIAVAKESGLKVISIYDAFTHEPPNEKSERIYYVMKPVYMAWRII